METFCVLNVLSECGAIETDSHSSTCELCEFAFVLSLLDSHPHRGMQTVSLISQWMERSKAGSLALNVAFQPDSLTF